MNQLVFSEHSDSLAANLGEKDRGIVGGHERGFLHIAAPAWFRLDGDWSCRYVTNARSVCVGLKRTFLPNHLKVSAEQPAAL